MVDDGMLEALLRNVGDMAFKRRVRTIMRGLDIQEGDRVLDCGCGEGFFLKMFGEISRARVCGTDADMSLLERARRETSAYGNVEVNCGDIYGLPYQGGFFDKIILSEVLEHVPDDGRALTEVKRVLKPGGLLFVTVPNANYPFLWDPINKVIEALTGRHIRKGFWAGIWNMHERLYRVDEIHRLVDGAGFKIVSVEVLTHYCIPFNHLFLNGMKRLLDRGVFPEAINRSADKFRYGEEGGSAVNPVSLGYNLFNRIDRLNDNLPPSKSSVSIAVAAVKT